MKHLLFVVYYYPPINSSGVHRTIGFLNHLDPGEWSISILTVAMKKQSCAASLELLDTISKNVTVYRAYEIDFFKPWRYIKRLLKREDVEMVTATSVVRDPSHGTSVWQKIKDQVSALLQTPDNQMGWLFPALWRSRSIPRPDLIYSSAPPFTSHIVAACLKRRWDVPLVADFRDPWSGNPFNAVHGGIAQLLDRRLERFVMGNADAVIANTQPMAVLIAENFPKQKDRIHVITNGYDPQDYESIKPFRTVDRNKFLLLHIGLLYEQRNPLPFLRAVQSIAGNEVLGKRLLVQLIGPSEKFSGRSLADYVEALGLIDVVELIPPVSHKEALARAKGADVLLLFAQGTTLQVPAKLFEYLALEKPIMGFCEPGSATEAIFIRLNQHRTLIQNDPRVIEACILDLLENVGNEALPLTPNPSSQTFLRKQLTVQLETIFRKLLERA